MTKFILPFGPGDEVNMAGFTCRGVITEVHVYGPDEVSYYVRECWDGGQLIGSFSRYELTEAPKDA